MSRSIIDGLSEEAKSAAQEKEGKVKGRKTFQSSINVDPGGEGFVYVCDRPRKKETKAESADFWSHQGEMGRGGGEGFSYYSSY